MDGDGDGSGIGFGWLNEVVEPHIGEWPSLSVRRRLSCSVAKGNGYPFASSSTLPKWEANMRSWSVVAPGVRPGVFPGKLFSNKLAVALGMGVIPSTAGFTGGGGLGLGVGGERARELLRWKLTV
jgi:hypothetical protein